MRLGTYWFARIGIVMLLTALVFFGNYAYQNFIGKLGPGGKISLMYLGSGLLLAAGAWWQRQAARPSLRNYAQVLFAGGLAAVYFTTYAAHHLENLRVIHSATLDGALLLAWAGFMVWIADRRQSEVLAWFGVGLGYYSAIMTRVGSFTLYSNLVLTAAAVFFLVRNRWTVLSFGSLAATYLGYVFWRFFDAGGWHWASPEAGLWSGIYFLGAYWTVFTAAVFLSSDERFAGQTRATFLTVNNGAFFTLFVLTLLQVKTGGFWKFSFAYGTVLLVLAEASRRRLANEPQAKNFYLAQGLLLVTVGLIARFSGLNLALVLGAESVILLLLGVYRSNRVLQWSSYLTALMSVGWAIDGMRPFDRPGLYLGAGLGALMLANLLIIHRHTHTPSTKLQARPAFFALLSLVSWVVTTWNNCERTELPYLLAFETVLFTLSFYALRVREMVVLGQGCMGVSAIAWLANWITGSHLPWWQPALLMAPMLGLLHWWQRQRALEISWESRLKWQGAYSILVAGILYTFLQREFEPGPWLGMLSLLALVFTAYGALTRAWMLAAAGQFFTLAAVLGFVRQMLDGRPDGSHSLAPIAALALLSLATGLWFARRPDASPGLRKPLLGLARGYRWLALGLTLWWVWVYIPAREQVWMLSALGLVFFVGSGWFRWPEGLLFSAAFSLALLVLFWLPVQEAPKVYWPNCLALLALLAEGELARRLPDRYSINEVAHRAIVLAGGLSLWLLLSRWVLEGATGFYLTASWSLLALTFFGTGMGLRDRIYRWLGLGVLACALGRVVLFDVWKLDTLYRMLSFFALGLVLLVLGFIYSRFQEKIRQWL